MSILSTGRVRTEFSVSTVQKWEQGRKVPNGTSLKLLNLVAKKGLEVPR